MKFRGMREQRKKETGCDEQHIKNLKTLGKAPLVSEKLFKPTTNERVNGLKYGQSDASLKFVVPSTA